MCSATAERTNEWVVLTCNRMLCHTLSARKLLFWIYEFGSARPRPTTTAHQFNSYLFFLISFLLPPRSLKFDNRYPTTFLFSLFSICFVRCLMWPRQTNDERRRTRAHTRVHYIQIYAFVMHGLGILDKIWFVSFFDILFGCSVCSFVNACMPNVCSGEITEQDNTYVAQRSYSTTNWYVCAHLYSNFVYYF